MRRPETSVSVVICAYSDEREGQLRLALDSVLAQTKPAQEIIAVIDHNPRLEAAISAAYPGIITVANAGKRGLSGGRNTGVRRATSDVVAFLDDDAIADPSWIERMVRHYESASIMGVGGGVIPIWPGERPRWFPAEFNWVVGCSYTGQPETTAPVRNPIGCNMSFRREVFRRVGDFTEGVGREGADAAGCEETEFCIRAHQAFPKAVILYDPDMKVQHHVSNDRTQLAYFRRRCLAEGRSKTRMVNKVGAGDGLSSERRYLTSVLPAGIVRSLHEAVAKLDPWGLARALGIVAGVGFTAFGYFGAKLSSSRQR